MSAAQPQSAEECQSPQTGTFFMSSYFVDEFVSVQPGEPFRVLPFGPIVKRGKKRIVTRELAKRFNIPHFQPAIKLGSHKDETIAGGHLTGLFVRDDGNKETDGLWSTNTLNENGSTAITEGHYKYHSPEIIWEDGALEDPKTGEAIPGPLIVGMALLHTPHLGEDTAFYSAEITEDIMTEETVQVPKTFWDSIVEKFTFQKPDEPETIKPETIKPIDPEQLTAIEGERDDYKAQLDTMKAEQDKVELFGAIREGFKAEEFGADFKAYGEDEDAIEMLASMTEDQRKWTVQKFGALSARVEASLTGEKGSGGAGADTDPRAALDQAIQAKATEAKVDYNSAKAILVKEQPELFE